MGRPNARFDEFTLGWWGYYVKHRDGVLEVFAGQAVIRRAGELIQYSTPNPEGAEYIAIC